MMTKTDADMDLSSICDSQIIEEAADRLRRQYLEEHGVEFRFGAFHFVFHEGRFQAVEDWSRNKCYISPKRLVASKA